MYIYTVYVYIQLFVCIHILHRYTYSICTYNNPSLLRGRGNHIARPFGRNIEEMRAKALKSYTKATSRRLDYVLDKLGPT